MRTVILTAALLAACCCVALAQAPAVTIDAHGVPAGDNLVANPGFEQGAEWPEAWGWAPNQPPSKIRRVWADPACSGERSAGVVNESANASGYWTQKVAMEAGNDYLLTCRVLLEEGEILVRALGEDANGDTIKGVDHRAYDQRRASHILAPAYWKPEWIQDMMREPWAPVDLVFDTHGDVVPDAVTLQIGSYFAPGALYIDDVYLGPGTLTLSYEVAGAPLTRVRLLDEAGDVQITSGDLDGATRYEDTVEGLALGGHWCVEATDQQGTITRAWYPEAPEGAQQ